MESLGCRFDAVLAAFVFFDECTNKLLGTHYFFSLCGNVTFVSIKERFSIQIPRGWQRGSDDTFELDVIDDEIFLHLSYSMLPIPP